MALHNPVQTRLALQSDARALAQLIDIAGEGIPQWLWSQSCEEQQTPLDIGEERARRDSGGFSYTNALVAQSGKETTAMVLSYPIDEAPADDPDDLPAPVAPFVELEAQSVGTWYINALAVRPGHRGQGIGTQLMADAEKAARDGGYTKSSIQVFEQNADALGLYRRLGYRDIGQSPVRDHPCQPYYTGVVILLEKTLHAAPGT